MPASLELPLSSAEWSKGSSSSSKNAAVLRKIGEDIAVAITKDKEEKNLNPRPDNPRKSLRRELTQNLYGLSVNTFTPNSLDCENPRLLSISTIEEYPAQLKETTAREDIELVGEMISGQINQIGMEFIIPAISSPSNKTKAQEQYNTNPPIETLMFIANLVEECLSIQKVTEQNKEKPVVSDDKPELTILYMTLVLS
ncbi:hypothetical protein PVK06_040203 [Gossypium arboreum]|uniref:Uncharacterized protein n=1 Tax=Gossypium arboreum TaxID=29729 RepID=A0ABR0N542_GOSAR|nr:hypothetical protein PVK06_040203 [Gossypium arboreum]